MAGKIKELIDKVLQQRTQGNHNIDSFVRAQLLLKGINPDKFNSQSADEQPIIEKLNEMLKSFD